MKMVTQDILVIIHVKRESPPPRREVYVKEGDEVKKRET